MPGIDGTGPMGAGAMTGRGFGFCGGGLDKRAGFGSGTACRRGFGRGSRRFFANGKITAENRREILQAQKDELKNRLAAIDRQMESP